MIRPEYYIVDGNNITNQPNKPIEHGSALESLKAINENLANLQRSNSPETIRGAVGDIFKRYNAKYEHNVTGWRSFFAWGSMYQRAQVAKIANNILERVPAAGSEVGTRGFLAATVRLREQKQEEAARMERAEARVEKHGKGLLSAIGDWWSGTETKEEAEEPRLLTRREQRERSGRAAKAETPLPSADMSGTRGFRDLSSQLREKKEAEAKTSSFWGFFGLGKKTEKKD